MNAMSQRLASVEAPSLKDAMRQMAGGVSVITAGLDDERTGLTVISAASLSLSPPAMIVCINKDASAIPVIRLRRHFCVNALAVHHRAVADRFAGRGGVKGAERYADAQWSRLATGALALDDALASIDCEVEELLERHSHVIAIGAVRAVRTRPGEPLVYGQGRYASLSAT
jgi:3-hydroxy-9,10-secoandrosta-1,3,5(10)-triene-9,17-dione monooxygenase reductase component